MADRIARIDCFQVAWPDASRFPARSAWVRVHDTAGRVGLGEASPMLDGDLSLAFLARHVAPGLIGADPVEAGVIQKRALHMAMKLGPHGIVAAALAALDIALWDLNGQTQGLPVHAMLGGAYRRRLPFYASLGGLGRVPEAAVLAQVADALSIGPALIKLRMEHPRGSHDVDVDGDIAKARAVRDRVGPGVRLAFDASNGYSVPAALRVGRVLQSLGFDWFEEPVEHYHLDATRHLADRLDIPVAAGEQCYTLQDVLALIQAGVRIVQPDLIKMGGFTGLLECRALAYAHGVELVPHQTQPGIGHVANLHFVAAQFGAVFPCELNDLTDRQHAVFRNPPRPEDGLFALTDAPGLGLQIDEERLAPLIRPIT